MDPTRVTQALQRTWRLGRERAGALLERLPFLFRGRRGRRLALVSAVAGVGGLLAWSQPVCLIAPGEQAVRLNLVTGGRTALHGGWALLLPRVHQLQRFSLLDQTYRTTPGARSDGPAPFQSAEGLSIGVDVTVRYALDAAKVPALAEDYGEAVTAELVAPVIDGALRRTFARHTVREIFATRRAEIQAGLEAELRSLLEDKGVRVRSVLVGNVDLPPQYRQGVEALLAEEMNAEKMRFTLELKEKQVKESELEAEAQKVRQEKAAEASAEQEIIAAKGRAEAMKHVLPFKEKEIEERRLEAEATKAARMKTAEGEAEARRIEARGEADARRALADSEAYRLDVTGKAQSEQLARDSALVAKNPLLIQKTLADKLSDKIQVIIAPPQAGGFIAGNLVGPLPKAVQDPAP